MNIVRRQLRLFFIAMGFFTRIPMPKWVEVDSDSLNQANRYFGLVGMLVGAISAAVFLLFSLLFTPAIAIVMAMIASVLITGGFHEDGLADTADGFGGGWSVADKLNIMKDSRLGSYGALALMLGLFLKWQLLQQLGQISTQLVVIALILGHTLSRVLAASLIFSESYVRDDDSSKSKPLAQQQSFNELLILLASAALSLLLLSASQVGIMALVLIVVRWGLVTIFRRQIGGYTGDTLGAAQQVSEIACYMVILATMGTKMIGVS